MIITLLWKYFFSYVDFTANKGFPERFLNLCAKYGVRVYSPKIEDGILYAGMSAADYRCILPLARRAQTVLKIRRKRGLRFTAIKYKYRSGLAVGAALFFILLNLFSSFVWNVNVVGSAELPREQILRQLCSAGIYEGCAASKLDAASAKQIRNELLNSIDSLSWAAMNLDGCILNVECRLKAQVPQKQEYTPCNIIASKGGRIISVKAYSGTPCVKAGQAVVSGQLLVSGTAQLTDGSTLFCHSSAQVFAEVENTLETFVKFKQVDKTTLSEPTKRSVLTVFGVNIPMFVGTVDGECKITRETLIPEFGDVRLPFSLTTATFYPIESYEYEIGSDEAKKRAQQHLSETAEKQFGSSIINTGEVQFSVKADGVSAVCTYLCEENICKEEKILINP